MSHTVQINLTADQEIRLLGEDVNIYEIETIFVESDGRIVWFTRKASQPYVEDGCDKCSGFVQSIYHNYCSNCGRILPERTT